MRVNRVVMGVVTCNFSIDPEAIRVFADFFIKGGFRARALSEIKGGNET